MIRNLCGFTALPGKPYGAYHSGNGIIAHAQRRRAGNSEYLT